ncbi:MAG: hypothetical protein HZA16_07025 [Nitrospirae bacterium]|nr:hypothetical protein [Nitrospirota bacterium]
MELLISITIISVIAGVFVNLVAGSLDSWKYNKDRGELINTAQLAMDRMVSKVRNSRLVLLPLKISDPTDLLYPVTSYYPLEMLAVSANIDNDGDGLADEDPPADTTGDGASGIKGIDDDNDGSVDEPTFDDNDEIPAKNDDPIDGIDNDLDGRVDEDPGRNFYGAAFDDDGDGASDEDPFDPVIYYLNGTNLMEKQNVLTATTADNIIAENVSEFMVLRRRVNGNTLIDIRLTLDNGKGSVELRTTALARGMFKP